MIDTKPKDSLEDVCPIYISYVREREPAPKPSFLSEAKAVVYLCLGVIALIVLIVPLLIYVSVERLMKLSGLSKKLDRLYLARVKRSWYK
jgi:hypothetical protein